MTLYDKILALYPDLTPQDFAPFTGTISLRNDNDNRGDYIAAWTHPVHPRPTDEQLAAAENLPVPVPVPQSVPMWTVRTILQNDGLFDQAQALVTASTDNALKNVWEYGNFASRTSPSIIALGEALGLTSEQMDQMFISANALEV